MSLTLHAHILAMYRNPVFVETGSYEGGGVAVALQSGFEEVHSIEINPSFHARCAKRFAGDSRVHLYCGDSAKLLGTVLAGVSKRATLWLDAHPCAPMGGPPVPGCSLLDELAAATAASARRDHTVLVDDIDIMESLFGIRVSDVINRLLLFNPRFVFTFHQGGARPMSILAAAV